MKHLLMKKHHDDYLPVGSVHSFDDDDPRAARLVADLVAAEFVPSELAVRLQVAGQREPIHHAPEVHADTLRVPAAEIAEVKRLLTLLGTPVIYAAIRAIAAGEQPTDPERIVGR